MVEWLACPTRNPKVVSSNSGLTTVLCVLSKALYSLAKGREFELRPDNCVVCLEQGTLLVTQRP